MEIRTPRLLLRPFGIADFEAYLGMVSDPEVMRFLGSAPLSEEGAWNCILRNIGHWRCFGYGLFAVTERATNRFLGEAGVANFRRGIGDSFDRSGEAVWVFASHAHGSGYAHEAVVAALKSYGALPGRERTVCLVAPENMPSLRLAAKLNYTAIGATIHKDEPVLMLERRSDN